MKWKWRKDRTSWIEAARWSTWNQWPKWMWIGIFPTSLRLSCRWSPTNTCLQLGPTLMFMSSPTKERKPGFKSNQLISSGLLMLFTSSPTMAMLESFKGKYFTLLHSISLVSKNAHLTLGTMVSFLSMLDHIRWPSPKLHQHTFTLDLLAF